MNLYPYQQDGVEWLASQDRALLADEMGLGKTIQAITAVGRRMDEEGRILIVCPASLCLNWQREVMAGTGLYCGIAREVWIHIFDVVIISYNMLEKFYDELRAEEWLAIIADEAHKLQSINSKRTSFLIGGFGQSPIPTKIKYALTGTPMRNRPADLYPILKWLDCPWLPKQNGKPTLDAFGTRYCGGGDYRGSSNLDELRENLKTIRLRRLKKDVLTQLPPKTRQIVELEIDNVTPEVDDELIQAGLTYEDVVKSLDLPEGIPFAHKGLLAKLRQSLGMAKVEAAAEYILDKVEEVGKVIVFCHHREVVNRLNALINFPLGIKDLITVSLVGGMAPEDKNYAVRQFQENPKCAVFFGNIEAAGEGITLTAAKLVIFVEFSWVPSENAQCEDRAHRIGQADPVLIQYLVVNNSLDAHMCRALVRKQTVIDHVLD